MRLFYYELHILFNVPQAPFPTLARRAKRGGVLNPGHSSESSNTSYNMQRVRQAAILSSEILNLP
ncbi:hypothetical protein, partial [Aeromonas caviae]|uniref:hypothetical protein n=1 Tax=Aeromonas caviae TaxID=648 RepID=UPI001CC66DA0